MTAVLRFKVGDLARLICGNGAPEASRHVGEVVEIHTVRPHIGQHCHKVVGDDVKCVIAETECDYMVDGGAWALEVMDPQLAPLGDPDRHELVEEEELHA